KIRFLGVGAMIIGGIWSLVSIRKSLWSAISQGMDAFKSNKGKAKEYIRTEYDTPISWVIIGAGILVIPIFIIYLREIQDLPISALMSILMVIAGFLFSSVAGYMAGLVGSSNNPISGVTIATILTSALILAALMGTDAEYGAAAAIFIGAIVCCAAAIAGDNMQDLKSGYILGATPRNQQIMQMVGVVAAALVLTPVLSLLHTSYTIGSKALSAPQASLMSSVAEGIFGGELPWTIIWVGIAIGALIIIADEILKKRGSDFRMPVLAVAVGLYLPFSLDSAIFIGGLVAYFSNRFFKKRNVNASDPERKGSEKYGLLFASGLITGEALIGILLAIPIAITANKDFFKLLDQPLPSFVGAAVLVGICYWLYSSITKAYLKRDSE
ncbi:MAG: oligopeptide transporter, OPT family, partial [Chitinophagales bacterium]|nr:oligopeptide transporter, OPT family [Chitinophagales bacterium]